MNYLSVCSGIEAATVAWHSLGWKPVAFSEIEKFPSAVLAHHYPDIPNWGDMTKFKEWPDAAVDVLVGGTPCQSFSVAGLRKGLDDPRGNLMLTFGAIANRYRPEWLVWENVPGVLSSNGGRDFGTFLGMLAELGYGFAYRVLDAQYFGLAQRRKRVFVVGCLGDWRRAAAVLFERASLSGHSAPSRKTREGTAGRIAPCPGGSGGHARPGDNLQSVGYLIAAHPVIDALLATDHKGPGHNRDDRIVAHALRGEGFDASEDGTGRGTPIVPVSFNARQDPDHWLDRTGPLDCDGSTQAVQSAAAVRRLTPRECERLQGFPDDYTAIPWRGKPADQCPDGPRYKALGNSMAVPVMRWIGQRIQMVADLERTSSFRKNGVADETRTRDNRNHNP